MKSTIFAIIMMAAFLCHAEDTTMVVKDTISGVVVDAPKKNSDLSFWQDYFFGGKLTPVPGDSDYTPTPAPVFTPIPPIHPIPATPTTWWEWVKENQEFIVKILLGIVAIISFISFMKWTLFFFFARRLLNTPGGIDAQLKIGKKVFVIKK